MDNKKKTEESEEVFKFLTLLFNFLFPLRVNMQNHPEGPG